MAELAFADAETRSPLDLTAVGAYRYANHPDTDALVWTWAFDDEPGNIWSPPWAYDAGHDHIYPLYEHIARGGYFVAWNAFFDRWIWNTVMVEKYGASYLPLEQVLCAQAQAEANNLPGQLGKAAEALGTYHKKDPKGKRLISLLCAGTRDDWNPEHEAPEFMGYFRAYGLHDTYAMRDVWQHTRPLTTDEWAQYHASERVNDLGVAVDHTFARHAMHYAEAEFADINGLLAALTDDPRMTVTNHVRKAAWLYEALRPSDELREVMTKPPKKKGGPLRKSCDRSTREAVLELLSQPEFSDLFHMEQREQIIEFLELIEAGNSAAVRKFTAITNQACAGRIHGQYSFNGAGQTGRFSSRGVQIHNLIRDPVDKDNSDRALDAIEAILAGAEPDDLVREFGFPISRLLARLIRPTFIAPDGSQLVWADYDQIEGRVLPWLANSPQAESKLDLYRAGIDTYQVAAMPIYGLSRPEQCDDSQRQVGKVAELALSYGGAAGAFSAMSKGYGVVVSEQDAADIVQAWRAQNSWAPTFWYELWDAAIGAFNNPGQWHHAGRVRYMYWPELMHGTLICSLPSGRWLVYPQFKHEWYIREDDDGFEQRKLRTSFAKGFSGGFARVDLWYGVLCLAGDTQVLTEAGWKSLQDVSNERVWDGEEWVRHKGLVRKGDRLTIQAYGVNMTPEHLVLTTEGWHEGLQAQREGLERATVRLPDGYQAGKKTRLQASLLALPMRLRQFQNQCRERLETFAAWVMWLQDSRSSVPRATHSRYEQTPSIRSLAQHEVTMPSLDTSSVEKLRWPRYHRLQALARQFRKLLDRHGANVSPRLDTRSPRQQWQLHPGQLSLDDSHRASRQHAQQPHTRNALGAHAVGASSSQERNQCDDDRVPPAKRVGCGNGAHKKARFPEPVYDLMDCGPRNRFVVRGSDGPLIVHNCENITQAVAADFLRIALAKLDDIVVLHTHDELVVECSESRAHACGELLREVMTDLPEWAEGLPLTVSVESGPYYTK